MTEAIRFTTHYLIKNPDVAKYDAIEDFSSLDYKTEEKIRMAYIYDEETDILRIPAGVGDDYVKRVFNVKEIKQGTVTPFQPSQYNMINTPKDKQLLAIEKILKVLKTSTQVKCDLPTGTGKTFTATYLIGVMKLKPLIIVGTDNLRKQWVESFLAHTDINPNRILLMEGAKAFGYNYEDKDVFITTHHTIRSILPYNSEKNIMMFNKWLINNGIGVKVFDEADLETISMFKIDLLTSVLRTIYLTATDYKSSKEDDKVFQLATKNIHKFGSEFFADIIPDRVAKLALINSKPGQALFARSMSFANDFSPVKYCEYLFVYRLDIIKYFCNKAKELWEYCVDKHNPKARLLITVSRKAYCFILRDILCEEWGMSYKDIGVYNSSVDPKWKQLEFSKKIIISTLKSMGRGVDAPNLMVHYDSEPYSSGSMFYQAVGRTARNGSKGYYIAMYDHAYPFIAHSFKKKKPELNKLFKQYEIKEAKFNHKPTDRMQAKKDKDKFKTKWWKYLKEEDTDRKTNKKIAEGD